MSPDKPQTLRHVEIIHTSLTGLVMISVVLLVGLLLPLFGFNPLSSEVVAAVVVLAVGVGIAYLYLLNYNAHKVVREQARLTDVLLNSLGQGFLTFDAKGICGSVFSQASYPLLEADEIADRSIAEILKVPADKREEFMEWLGILFQPDHALSFDDAVRFLPDVAVREDDRNVVLSYRPIRNKDGILSRIVLIATDRTEEREAQKRADNERQFAAMICAIFAERQNFLLTMAQMRDMLDRLSDFGPDVFEPDFFRMVHTLKGAAMHFKMEKLGEELHALESVLRDSRDMAPEVAREAVSRSRGDVQLEYGRIQNVVRGIVGDDTERPQNVVEVDEDAVYQFSKLLKQQNASPDIIYAYESTVLSVPLFTLLRTLDRQIQPLAEKLEKRVRPIEFRGENVRLPSRPLQYLVMALTHVVHNILDHGIESPLARMAKGKEPQGRVTIEVARTADEMGAKWIEIIIADDGAGIDPNRVRSKLTTIDPNGSWRFDDDETVIQQLLTCNISTRDEVSMLSGRGEGMGAVYQEVLRLGGRCTLRSEMHKGTQLTIKLPEHIETLLP